MWFFTELKEFIRSILSWIIVLVGFSFFFFLFDFKEVFLFDKAYLLPLPSTYDSFASQALLVIQEDLLPQGVELIVTNPLSAFLAQVIVSLLMAFIVTLPYFFYKMFGYLFPALFESERKAILKVLLPSVFLFFAGCAFAYHILIPLIFKTLYPYTVIIGAVPFFSVQEFISLVFGIMIAVGIMFLLPVFMSLLAFLGLIGPSFWKRNWRHALLVFLIFSAIITPDGTGISMMILSAPLAGLYFLGVVGTVTFSRSRDSNANISP